MGGEIYPSKRRPDYIYDVADGKVGGKTTWNKFGYNLDVDTGSPEVS